MFDEYCTSLIWESIRIVTVVNIKRVFNFSCYVVFHIDLASREVYQFIQFQKCTKVKWSEIVFS